MVKRTTNNYNYQYPQRDKEIIDRISDPNYEVGNYTLPKNASAKDKFKYGICQTILKHKQKNHISYQVISQQIGLPFAKTMDILKGRVNNFNLTELKNYLERIQPKIRKDRNTIKITENFADNLSFREQNTLLILKVYYNINLNEYN